VTLREKNRLRVFENRVLRRIFAPKRDEVIGGSRKLHSEELHNLYTPPKYDYNYQVKEDEMGRACSKNGKGEEEEEYCIRDFGGKSRRKETTRKTHTRVRRWEDNIKNITGRRMGWYGLDCSGPWTNDGLL
jgi:PAS domain-containing protein